uniref:RNA 2'-phosphotransferase n=1 Tax=Nesodiprion zhejiangensis nucleopolyhedrovirus TaxID=3135970 RepID=A0AAN0LPH3_9BACU
MFTISKKMSYLLRHDPQNLNMDMEGFVNVQDMSKKLEISLQMLNKIVDTDNKQRYEIVNDKIRAVQGHSIKNVNVSMPKVEISYNGNAIHGTFSKNLPFILTQGIKRFTRKHIHLATDMKSVRKNTNVFIYVDISKCIEDGIICYYSANNYILTEGIDGVIPPKYFLNVEIK